MFATTTSFCEGRVAQDSIYALLHRECFNLFPDEIFADLFREVGRRSVPPMIVGVVMVLQRIEGCSDREAVERFTYDARWKYAAGGLDFDYPGFVHTVLVEMRARLARSERPNRIFEVTLAAGRQAGLTGRRRVLDSTPLYDAVATMDTVTLIRSAIRGLLGACDADLEGELRGLIKRDDDYATAGKPVCDYDDKAAREALVDALATDANALLLALEGRELSAVLGEAAALLAVLVGQDLDEGEGGVFRIARRVAKDRIISTVDREARHGHKTSARGFDGYKGHVAIDPDSELITSTVVGAANAGDAVAATELLADELAAPATGPAATESPAAVEEPAAVKEPVPAERPVPAEPPTAEEPAERERPSHAPRVGGKADAVCPAGYGQAEPADKPLAVYGDAAYGAGELLAGLEAARAEINCKVQPPVAPGGRFSKDAFEIDLDAGAVSCPAGHSAPLRAAGKGQIASFGAACAGCPLAERCTTSKSGRTVWVGPYEAQLTRARARQADPDWKAGYTATRPKVERKIAHLMRCRHGARRARVRGRPKVAADFALLAAAVNLARLGMLGLAHQNGAWTASTA